MTKNLKEFTAIIWKKGSEEPGVHETVFARNGQEARLFLEKKYGEDILVSLRNDEAAQRPR